MQIQNQFEIENGVLKAYLGAAPDVEIPEGVHTIGDGVFKGMSWLLSVRLPKGLIRIGAGAFKGCRKMKTITFPEGLTEIGEYAFHRCHDLKEILLPDSLTQVADCAFLYCDSLEKVVIRGPKSLGKGTFSHNLSLREIHLNKELDDSNFGDEVFEGCVRLHRIYLSENLFEVDNLIEAMNSHSDYPKIIKSVSKSVFHSMQIEDGELLSFNINLKLITIPEGITTIGKSCFFDKKGIISITFPESLRLIRANAFLNCISLSEVTFQNENVTLDDKAFRGCSSLKKVHCKGTEYQIAEETDEDSETPLESMPEFICRIRDQVLSEFYISGSVLIRYLGREDRIRIPKEVKIIGERAFFGNEQLKTVLCPEGLTEIREQAFAGCVTLTSIDLPSSLKRVEREAFAECKKLLSCPLPASTEFIGEYAFRRCFCLKVFDPWPEHAVIHPYAFYLAKHFLGLEGIGKTSELGRVQDHNDSTDDRPLKNESFEKTPETSGNRILPYAYTRRNDLKVLHLTGVKYIGKYAFSSCPNLEEVILEGPDCVVEERAFATCPKLKKVVLHVRAMGKAAFAYCRNLEEVRLSGVSILPEECFAGCSSLGILQVKAVEHPSDTGVEHFVDAYGENKIVLEPIREIKARAFERCDLLQSLRLDQVTCGYHAFADCSGLKEIELTGRTVLGSGVFTGCTQVRRIVWESEAYEFSRFSDGLNHVGNPYPMRVREVISSIYSCFDIRDKRILCGYSQDAAAVTIPADLEEIGQDVFRDHARLCQVTIPETVRRIGSHAFSMTSWLDHERAKGQMVLVNDILLDGAASEGCVVLPGQISRVSSWCFAGNTRITELVIPSEGIVIEPLAFRNCLNLKKITDWNGAEYVLSRVSDLKQAGYPELILRIFTECINCYKLDEDAVLVESTGNLSDLVFPEGIRAIGDGVYKDCHLLERIVLSSETKSIGKCAFENSKWLKQVKRAGSVEVLGSQAFSGCQSLESIDLSDHLRDLGKRAFEHCCSLQEIHLSGRLERIPERAFFRCKSLTRVTIPESVKEIEAEAFAFCDGLKEVSVPKQTKIAEDAFAFCDQVKIHKY